MRIALDGDGVIFDFMSAWRACAFKTLGEPVSTRTRDYALGQRYGLTPDETEAVWRAFNETDQWGEMPLLPGARAAVLALREAGHDLHMVTAIEPEQGESRARSLTRNGIGMPLHLVGRHQSKHPVFEKLQPDIVVDDQLRFLEDARLAGVVERIWIVCDNLDPGGLRPHQVVTDQFHFLDSYVQRRLVPERVASKAPERTLPSFASL